MTAATCVSEALARRGFTLLEMTIAMAISAPILAGIWQLTAAVGQKTEATALASQALSVSSAAKSYIDGNTSTLLAMPELAGLGDVARVKVTDIDTGDTATSVQGAGYLPQSFVNLNSFGQSYALFVRREDSGTLGVADSGDRVIGLLVTTGGADISDMMGAKIASSMGAPGGFLYADSNPATPSAATTARGAYGGWQIDLTAAGWSNIGSVAKAGHVASLVHLLPSGSGGGGGGASEIDDLDDGATDYGNGNMFLGQDAGDAVTSGVFNTALGTDALKAVSSASNNTAFGAYALKAQTTGSGANTAVGFNALVANLTGASNTALGSAAGSNITSGSNNIILGAGINAPSATASNQLNIGNTIYGDLSTDQVNIGSATMVAGIGFDVGTNTSASRLSVGTTAQRPTCTASLEGAQRVNSQTQTMEICVGGAWLQPSPAWVPATGTPPTPPTGTGYIVLSANSWNGNLGGFAGANAKCLSELTTYDWMGKATAIAAGLLNATKVRAVVSANCGTNNQTFVGQTNYYFAVADQPTVGGALFSTGSAGQWPQNTTTWSAGNYLNGYHEYWSGNGEDSGGGTNLYRGYVCNYGSNHCSTWTDSSAGGSGRYGRSTGTGDGRFWGPYGTCDVSRKILCAVNP